MDKKKTGGQVVLMVLLASALVLTLGLSAARQATVETKIDTDQELLKKAFNAAESGIEYYLGTGKSQFGDVNSVDGGANLMFESVGATQSLSFDSATPEGGSEYYWLVTHETDGSLGNVYYGGGSIQVCDRNSTNGSFVVDYFYKEGIAFKVERGAETSTVNGCITLAITKANPVLLSVRPIGFSPIIVINGSESFPLQGQKISSTGTVQGVNNTVSILSRYDFPTFLLEAITSEGSVTN